MTPTVDHDTRQPGATTTTTTTADNTIVDVTGDIAVSLVYHSTDFTLTPISDVSKVRCCNSFIIYLFKIEIVHKSTQRNIKNNKFLSLPIHRQIQHNSVQLINTMTG